MEIRSGRDACDAVESLAGKRFLPEDAPRLPLEDCTCECTCRFVHHADRRHFQRRSELNVRGQADEGSGQKLRRSGVDRRRRF